jgi:hypothetical protein
MNPHRIIEAAQNVARKLGARRALSRLEDISSAAEYAEPGYDLRDKALILLGNWNGFSNWNEAEHRFVPVQPDDRIMCRTVKSLEQCAELEWEDEWERCSGCGKAFRVTPDSYGWEPSFVETEDGRCCLDCVDPETVLEEFVNNPRKALSGPLRKVVRPQDHGFIHLDQEFEHGFHPGQDADPKKILASLQAKGCTRVLFTIDGVGQFDVRFSVWIGQEDFARVAGGLAGNEVNGPSVSGALQRALESASRQSAALPPGDGPIVSTIGAGGATTRRVSVQDFVEGRALDAR